MSVELNKDMNLVIQLRLIAKGNNEPLSGSAFKVRLYDKDVLNDDFLGESDVQEGLAKFSITQKDFSSPARLDDKPDFYFVLLHNEQLVFKSKVMSNLDISDIEQFVMNEGELIDLGTFLVDVDADTKLN